MAKLTQAVFGSEYGLFVATPLGTYYPNPVSHILPDFEAQMVFTGRVLGKALYEAQIDCTRV